MCILQLIATYCCKNTCLLLYYKSVEIITFHLCIIWVITTNNRKQCFRRKSAGPPLNSASSNWMQKRLPGQGYNPGLLKLRPPRSWGTKCISCPLGLTIWILQHRSIKCILYVSDFSNVLKAKALYVLCAYSGNFKKWNNCCVHNSDFIIIIIIISHARWHRQPWLSTTFGPWCSGSIPPRRRL